MAFSPFTDSSFYFAALPQPQPADSSQPLRYSVLQAVQAMHAGGLLHGDLEPRHIRWATPYPSREPLLSGLRIIDLDRASLGSVEQRDEEMERLRAKIGWISPWPLKRTR